MTESLRNDYLLEGNWFCLSGIFGIVGCLQVNSRGTSLFWWKSCLNKQVLVNCIQLFNTIAHMYRIKRQKTVKDTLQMKISFWVIVSVPNFASWVTTFREEGLREQTSSMTSSSFSPWSKWSTKTSIGSHSQTRSYHQVPTPDEFQTLSCEIWQDDAPYWKVFVQDLAWSYAKNFISQK